MALGVLGMSSHCGQAKVSLEPLAKVSNHIIVMKHLLCARCSDGCSVQFMKFDPHTYVTGKDFYPQLTDEKTGLARLKDLPKVTGRGHGQTGDSQPPRGHSPLSKKKSMAPK